MNKIIVSLFMALMLLSGSIQAATNIDIITFGDSLTAGLYRNSSGVVTCPPGVSNQLNPYNGVCNGNGVINRGGYQPTLVNLLLNDSFMPVVANYGYSGIRTDQMVSRISSIIAARPNAQYILIMGGANDAYAGVSSSTVIANLSIIINQSKGQGLIPVIATVTPNSTSASRNQKTQQYSQAIRNYAAANQILIVDSRVGLGANWNANNSGDGVHYNANGNVILGGLFYSALTVKPAKKIILAPIIDLLL